jgi:hypothetical protein
VLGRYQKNARQGKTGNIFWRGAKDNKHDKINNHCARNS